MTENKIAQKEKRSSVRYRPKSGTHIVYMEGFAEVKDLSVIGMFAMDPDPLPAGTAIKFVFRLGTDDIHLQGTVSRCEPGRGMVILFKDITPEARRRLRIYIHSLDSTTEKPAR